MTSLLGTLALSFAFSVLIMPIVRRVATLLGFVDKPDGRRKIHTRPIPLAGGMGILISVIIALGIVYVGDDAWRETAARDGSVVIGLLLASIVICAIGVADDAFGMRGRHKLTGQLLCITVLLASGVIVHSITIFGWQLDLGMLAVPFTVAWLLGAINSLNLIDGMDGLSGCVGVIIAGAMCVLAFLGGHILAGFIAAALVGALLGFLCYNLPPASIFMGDCGSMLLGLLIGVLAIQSSMKGPATLALMAPLAMLTVPFIDTIAAIVRRKLTGRSVYSTDRGHLHHCLQQKGFSTRAVLLFVSALCLLTLAGTLLSVAMQNELFAMLSALAVVAILVVSKCFGHVELILISKRLKSLANSYVRFGHDELEPRKFEIRLQGSAGWNVLWDELVHFAGTNNFVSLCLDVNAPSMHEGYHARWSISDQAENSKIGLWHFEFPLTIHDQTVGRMQIIGNGDLGTIQRRFDAVIRLTQFMLNPDGLEFIGQQEMLSGLAAGPST